MSGTECPTYAYFPASAMNTGKAAYAAIELMSGWRRVNSCCHLSTPATTPTIAATSMGMPRRTCTADAATRKTIVQAGRRRSIHSPLPPLVLAMMASAASRPLSSERCSSRRWIS